MKQSKEPVWVEVKEIPEGTSTSDILLIPGHKFIRRVPKNKNTRVIYGDVVNVKKK